MYRKEDLEREALEYISKLEELLACEEFDFNVNPDRVPKKRGVYVIFNKRDEKSVYVGRTYKRDLYQRILYYHKKRGSQFRTVLGRLYNLQSKEEMSKYIMENCSFRFKVIEDPEDRVRLEHFATAILNPILNVKLKTVLTLLRYSRLFCASFPRHDG